jgi:hypothetical protein
MHDNARLCALSMYEEMPVIMVNIGYRVNWLGFLACEDLLEEARMGGGNLVGRGGCVQRRVAWSTEGISVDPGKHYRVWRGCRGCEGVWG